MIKHFKRGNLFKAGFIVLIWLALLYSCTEKPKSIYGIPEKFIQTNDTQNAVFFIETGFSAGTGMPFTNLNERYNLIEVNGNVVYFDRSYEDLINKKLSCFNTLPVIKISAKIYLWECSGTHSTEIPKPYTYYEAKVLKLYNIWMEEKKYK